MSKQAEKIDENDLSEAEFDVAVEVIEKFGTMGQIGAGTVSQSPISQ